jgi:hypothetical protein
MTLHAVIRLRSTGDFAAIARFDYWWWPAQAACRLEWGNDTHGQGLPGAFFRALAAHSYSISTVAAQPVG